MASTSTQDAERITINFAWQGPNRSGDSLDDRVVRVVFSAINTQISVELPENISPHSPQQFVFTFRELCETTNLALWNMTIEKVRHLDLVVVISGRQKTESRKVALEIPETLEPGQTYTLLITSEKFEFSACLIKEETRKESEMKTETLPAGQQPHPTTTPSTSTSDSNRLRKDELQALRAAWLQRCKQWENAYLKYSTAHQLNRYRNEHPLFMTLALINGVQALKKTDTKTP